MEMRTGSASPPAPASPPFPFIFKPLGFFSQDFAQKGDLRLASFPSAFFLPTLAPPHPPPPISAQSWEPGCKFNVTGTCT